jgi:hypothetical protein
MGSIISSFRIKTDKKVYPLNTNTVLINRNKTIYLVNGKVVNIKEKKII